MANPKISGRPPDGVNSEGTVFSAPGIKHAGSAAFLNRTLKRRKRDKLAKKARRKQRRK